MESGEKWINQAGVEIRRIFNGMLNLRSSRPGNGTEAGGGPWTIRGCLSWGLGNVNSTGMLSHRREFYEIPADC